MANLPPLFADSLEPLAAPRDQVSMGTSFVSVDMVILQLAVGFALTAIACGLILAGRISIRRSAESETWPAVEGMVLESAVAAVNDGKRQLFRPVIRYRYEIDGRRYDGNRIQWVVLDGFRTFTRARKFLDGYRTGSTIAVHYHPKQPGLSVLQPGHAETRRAMMLLAPTSALYALFAIGCVFVGI